MNKATLIGRLAADPELRQTGSGIAVTSFTIAVDRPYSGKESETQTDWIDIVAWRHTAEFVCKYFKKGMPILICGQLQTRNWTDNQGNKRYATEVVADEVSFVGNNENATEAKSEPSTYVPTAYGGNNTQFEEIPNDGDLPF